MILALTTIMISLVSANSFGVPYMAPIAPFTYMISCGRYSSAALTRKRMQYQKTIDDTVPTPDFGRKSKKKIYNCGKRSKIIKPASL